jgi:hypothetical protein
MPAEALRAVRARIASGWSQDVNARDRFGIEVSLTSDDATAWTLCSAFAPRGQGRHSDEPVARRPASDAEVTGMESIEGWNDDSERTQQQVLDALDDAIERVEGVDPAE